MGNINKGFSLLFVVVLGVSSLMMVESAFAQSITKPAVPEFTLKFVEHPYNTQTGQLIENKSIEFTIRNQPFSPYTAADSHHEINLFYNVSYKEQNKIQWSYYYDFIPASLSNYTIVTIGLGTMMDRGNIGNISGQTDFRLQALIGYYNSHEYFPDTYLYSFIGETSSWSNTQTINIPEPSTSPNPTPTPTVPEFSSWIIPLLLTIMLATAGLLVYHKRRTKQYSKETLTKFSQGSYTRNLITKTHPTMKWLQ
jgi:hypothetical protein